jgi:3-deoxy-7-phosphoheptulonate synthase
MEFLSSYQSLKTRFPLSSSQHLFIDQSRQTVRHILNGQDPRLLLIVGPCSIHDSISAKEFAIQLKNLALAVSSQFFLVMRVYCEKPRTSFGWKGFLYDPLLNGSHQIQLGLDWSRQLLLELASLEIPTATEFLDPLTAFYLDDLITWGSIGARTSSSQTHRQLASGLAMPIGFKNGSAGSYSAAVNGVYAACQPHTYLGVHEEGQLRIVHTSGNPDAHVVLRGGETGPNYDSASIATVLQQLSQLQLPTRLLIDCSHQNSNKKFDCQPSVFQSVLAQIREGNTNIRGLMLESHLFSGSQLLGEDLSQLQYGVSITDGCLDWSTTSQLIQWGAKSISTQALEAVHFSEIYS